MDMKPSTDHLMQSMAIGYPGGRGKMDGEKFSFGFNCDFHEEFRLGFAGVSEFNINV